MRAPTPAYCLISLSISAAARAAGYQATCPRCGTLFRDAEEWSGAICRAGTLDPHDVPEDGAMGPGKFVHPFDHKRGRLAAYSKCFACSTTLREHDQEGNCPQSEEENRIIDELFLAVVAVACVLAYGGLAVLVAG